MNCKHFVVGIQIPHFDAELLKNNFRPSTTTTNLDQSCDGSVILTVHADLGNWNCVGKK